MPLTKLNNKAVANITSLPVALGDMVLVSSATASSSASIEFTLGNYKEYKFYFVDVHPATDSVDLMFNFSTDNGSNYNVVKTSSYFGGYHNEADSSAGIFYATANDLAQSTAYQQLFYDIGNNNDQTANGYLTIFNPSSTTYVKHFIGRGSAYNAADFANDDFVAGYANTTSALTNIKFQFNSGNIDDGTILMYGIN